MALSELHLEWAILGSSVNPLIHPHTLIDLAYYRWLATSCRADEYRWFVYLMRQMMESSWTIEPNWSAEERTQFLQHGFRTQGPGASQRQYSHGALGPPAR